MAAQIQMDDVLQRFLNRIGVRDQEPFRECCFSDMSFDDGVNRVYLVLRCPRILPLSAYRELFSCIDKLARAAPEERFDTTLNFEYVKRREGLDQLLDAFTAENSFYGLGDATLPADENNPIIFNVPESSDETLDSLKDEADQFEKFLKQIGLKYKVALVERKPDADTSTSEPASENDSEDGVPPIDDSYAPSRTDYDIPDDSEEEGDGDLEDIQKFRNEQAQRAQEMVKRAMERENRLKTEYEQRRKDMLTYYPAKIKDIDNLKRVLVEGTIFKVSDMRQTKKGKHFLTIEYSDGSSSIASTLFENKKITLEILNSLKPGVKIRVKGEVQDDKYLHQLAIDVHNMEFLPPDPLREDKSEEKRVELHLHTNMSAMDGIASITKYASLAHHFGMKAIGITDHGVVQAFPEAQKIGKKLEMKMLYGCELYMVDEHLDICLNTRDEPLDQADYVIFDLETTGLSAHYDRIIEFGATRYSHGQHKDDIDFFINPDRQLRDFIKKKTNITQEMVDAGRPIKEALKAILEFFGDSVIIDHNAAFDIGFLNEALKNNGLPQIKNPVIDTLPLSRYMYPHQRSHTLEDVARTLGISYDDTKVHRAIYDAQVLESVYLGLLSVLEQTTPKLNMKDLENLTSKDVILTARPKHVIAYAKNEQGLKDLYKIISLSSTEYLANVPKTPRSLIEKYRENLIIGSACFNGEVFDSALTKSTDVLKGVMKFYDYIEVQPPACYSWLINNGQISDDDSLKMILKDLIDAAEDIGKMVVATGDCHYLNPEDKIFRDVYIFSKGLKGARHPLNPFGRDKQKPYPNPDQHFLSTDEMLEAFSFLGDQERIKRIVITNSNKIADALGEIYPSKDRLYPPYIKDCDTNLINLVYKTAKEIYGDPIPEPIKKRLDTELHGIGTNGYYVIYWIASVLVRKVNQTGHLVGSRGSVGSSLVATMSGITEVNPLPPHWICPKCKHLIWADAVKCPDGFDLPDRACPQCGTKMRKDGHDIPFETFLGFHADKVPDIDLNFPSDYQAQAHEMTRELMGADNVFKAGTIQTTEEKNGIGYAKGYFENRGIDPKTIRPAEIDRLAMGCVGVKRTTGQHPGGIIVIPSNMSVFDFTPYQYPANSEDASWKTTHYDFHAIHDNVLKFDELAHLDPWAVKMMSDMVGVDWKKIPFDDPEVMSIYTSTKALHLKKNILKQKTGALGLPEFGTNLGRQILEETKPKGFGDLVRISGLSHGTNVYAGNAQDLILSGKATLRDVIGCRDDIMIGLHNNYGVPSDKAFTIMEFVRHGMYAKPGNEEKGQQYIDLMKSYNVPDDYIESCKKIAYLFPKGHACAYVMMAVRVAWFKVHYPEVYYAVYFSLRCDAYDLKIMQSGQSAALNWMKNYENRRLNRLPIENKDKALYNTLTNYVEMTDRGIRFGHLSIDKSQGTFFSVDPETKEIIPPFSAVDSLGEVLANKIVEERKKAPFTTIEDFERRCRISKAISQKLRELGAYKGIPEAEQMSLDEMLG